MNFLELLQPQGDKVSVSELILARKNLPDHVTESIPSCVFLPLPKDQEEDSLREYDLEVVIVLAWIIARRENPEITMEDVGDRISIGNEGQLKAIVKEIQYFYTNLTREFIEDLHTPATEDDKENEEGDTENPPPEETALE